MRGYFDGSELFGMSRLAVRPKLDPLMNLRPPRRPVPARQLERGLFKEVLVVFINKAEYVYVKASVVERLRSKAFVWVRTLSSEELLLLG